MSVRLEAASSERLDRSSFITVGATTDYTVAGYFYLHSLPGGGSYAPLFMLYVSSAFAGLGVFVNSSGNLVVRDDNGDTFSSAGSATLSTGQWYYLWCRIENVGSEAFDVHCYLNESTSADLSVGTFGMGPAAASLQIGSNEASYTTDYYADASFFNWKWWSTDQAASNAATEEGQAAFNVAGLARWLFSTFSDIDDDEGSLDFTAVGTHSEGPTNPWGGGGGGRVTKNTRAFPLGMAVGMNWVGSGDCS